MILLQAIMEEFILIKKIKPQSTHQLAKPHVLCMGFDRGHVEHT